ncbi:MAG: 3-keto-disaccharide hydrolase, partial [Thermoanaerobaculia bacterium]
MRSIALAIVPLILSSGASPADDPPPPALKPADKENKEKGVSLFDGKTLKGWKVTNCEAVVQDGAILLKAGNGLVRTERPYRDFVLELEWKALKPDAWDSGIYFRCGEPPAGAAWPRNHQANLKKGMEGNVDDLKGARSTGLVKPGEWNRFQLTVVGATAKLEING